MANPEFSHLSQSNYYLNLPFSLASCPIKVIVWKILVTWNITCANLSAKVWSKMEYHNSVFHPVSYLYWQPCQVGQGAYRDMHHITAFSLTSSVLFQQYMWKPPKQTQRKEIKIKLILSKDKKIMYTLLLTYGVEIRKTLLGLQWYWYSGSWFFSLEKRWVIDLQKSRFLTNVCVCVCIRKYASVVIIYRCLQNGVCG